LKILGEDLPVLALDITAFLHFLDSVSLPGPSQHIKMMLLDHLDIAPEMCALGEHTFTVATFFEEAASLFFCDVY
jgi:hypothetical protein